MAGCPTPHEKRDLISVSLTVYDGPTWRRGDSADYESKPCRVYFGPPAGTGTHNLIVRRWDRHGWSVYWRATRLFGKHFALETVFTMEGTDLSKAYLKLEPH